MQLIYSSKYTKKENEIYFVGGIKRVAYIGFQADRTYLFLLILCNRFEYTSKHSLLAIANQSPSLKCFR